jgi:hypothetical protein
VQELKNELARRGLIGEGLKPDLIQRLQVYKHIYLYISTYTYIYIYIYVYIYSIYIYVDINMYMYLYIYIYIYMNVEGLKPDLIQQFQVGI